MFALAQTTGIVVELGDAMLRLLVAAAIGGLIGIEREHRGRSAGFRTHMLVSVGAALVALVGLRIGAAVAQVSTQAGVRADVAGVIAGVMGGIGFLGAGAILRSGLDVRGLTTAASLWCTAAVGMAMGFGLYWLSLVVAAVVLVALFVLSRVDELIPSRLNRRVTAVLPYDPENLDRLRQALQAIGGRITGSRYERDLQTGAEQITFELSVPTRAVQGLGAALVQAAPHIGRLVIE